MTDPLPSTRRSMLPALTAMLLAWLPGAGPASAAETETAAGVVRALPRPPSRSAVDEGTDDPTAPAPAFRIVWGGGKPRRWTGSIRVVGDTPGEDAPAAVSAAASASPAIDWRLLSPDAMASARIHATGRMLVIHQPTEMPLDGVEIAVVDWSTARIVVELIPDGRGDEATRVEVTVAELIRGPCQQSIDGDANRLTLRRAPGDELRVAVQGGAVRVPGETVRLAIHPLLPPRDAGAATVELRLKVRDAADGTETFSRTSLLKEIAAEAAESGVGATPRRFESFSLDIPLPPREGAHDITMEVTERGGLRWTRPLAQRTVQVVAVTATAEPAQDGGEWRTVYELDPNSPRLMERLRRLPAMGRSAASNLPQVPLPMLPIPKVPLPPVSIPKLPAVGQVVPRLTGLLPSGHSMLEPHPAGALFRLPAARSAEEPTWEAVHLAGAVPGAPHRLEIDHPLSDDQSVAITVLEQVGATVVATYQGGFAVEAIPGSNALERHACIFWPQTRTPLVVIANASSRRPASFGIVRILSGPNRLSFPPPGLAARAVYGFVAEPDFGRFGGLKRIDPATGRAVSDWRSVLTAARTSAEWFAAQGTAGSMVTVYSDGAALWPSASTAMAPLWDDGSAFDGALDPVPKDALEILCRVYRRQGLKIVPAVNCNGPLLAIEARLATSPGDATGLVCVGRDGRPRRATAADQPARYNILDPRVQAAVEDVVGELAARLEGREAVDGLALLVPHDGWLHLPGVAWALDDVTFARFVADTPAVATALAAAGPEVVRASEDRHALRAALVEGPFRAAWLQWRCGVIAGFVGRLAARVASHDPAWHLSIAPTTLFSAGDLAPRFRPILATEPAGVDICAEIGLDPALLTATDGVVWVSPHVHLATADMMERDALRAMNRGAGLAGAAARRRAAAAIDRPTVINLQPVLAHGAFNGSSADALVRVHAVAGGGVRERIFAEMMADGDCERIYDQTLAFRATDNLDRHRSRILAALPHSPLEAVSGVPQPLLVRAGHDATASALLVTNLSATRCRALLEFEGDASGARDESGAALAIASAGAPLTLELAPLQTRVVRAGGGVQLRGAGIEFPPGTEDALRHDLARLRQRRAALEMPMPLAVLDNPGFELPDHGGDVPGWQLLEPQRGKLHIVSGAPGGMGRGVAFDSDNGLATLRSNPFPAPATGRISIALWLRIDADAPQPQLRIAIEGVQDDREYYRFAAVGHGPSARPLSAEWSQYVLQVDDLPTNRLESLRVRLDLVAGGSVQVDDVRVFDLAFDESQRVQLSKAMTLAEHRLANQDLGGCITALDSHWRRFLEAFVSEEAAMQAAQVAGMRHGAAAAADAESRPGADASAAGRPAGEVPRTGILDRVRRWWK